jgi:choline-sulfatase
MPTNKPNIVLIMCDQMAARAVGCYGQEAKITPNIDRLAEGGALFTNFYCNSPICCPSRASMFSGQFVSDVGVYDNGAEFHADTPTFLHGLKGSGYRNFLSGKAHFVGPDQLHGFDIRLTRGIYPSSFIWTPNWLEPVALNNGSNIAQVQDSGSCIWSLQLEYDDEVLHRGLECLRAEARRQDNEKHTSPFFLNISFTHPHDPFFMPEEYLRRVHDNLLKPPRSNWGDAACHPYNQWINRHHGHDEIHLSETEILRARLAYYAACAYIDDCVGTVVNEIRRLGLSEQTLVIFTADHGEMMGEHGMWFKRTFFDEAVRVPFFACWPGTIPAGRIVDSTASLVDLFPTLSEIAGVDLQFVEACELRGSSLASLMTSGDDQQSRCAIFEYLGEGTTEPLRGIVGDGLKLVDVRTQPSILFDLQADPFEIKNLFEDLNYGEREKKLRAKLEADWDADRVKSEVIRSQTRRRIINNAAYDTQVPNWDCLDTNRKQGALVKTNAQAESEALRFPRLRR